jgi:formylmethanofuran:tetrahydromethanopterin formyltransferase
MNMKIISSYWLDFSVLLLSLFIVLVIIGCTTGNIYPAIAKTKDSINSNNHTSLVGQLAYEGQGKIVGKREVGVPGADGTFKIEVSYAGIGSFKGVNVTEMWTFLDTHRPDGVIQGVGSGIVTTKDHNEISTAEGYGRGHVIAGGKIEYPTVQLYNTIISQNLYWAKQLTG